MPVALRALLVDNTYCCIAALAYLEDRRRECFSCVESGPGPGPGTGHNDKPTNEIKRINTKLLLILPFPGSRCEVYLDGIPLKGEWRGGTRRPNRRGEEVKAGCAASQCNHMHGESCSRLLNLV